MWINRAINPTDPPEPLHFAKVTQISDSTVDTISHIQTINTPIVSPMGIASLPQVGQEVLIVPTMSGEYACMGSNNINTQIAEGELRLYSAGGAYIHLKSNGDIVLNGVIITTSGEIIPLPQGGE